MPIRRGYVAPRTTIIETIIRKFDTHARSFLVANAHQGSCHIIFCSDGFCRLTGFSKAEVMQKSAICEFLHGPMTSQQAVEAIHNALRTGTEKHFEILYYKKNGTKFLCSEVIALIRSESDDIFLQIINFEDLSFRFSPVQNVELIHPRNENLSTHFDRARASFRAGLSRTGIYSIIQGNQSKCAVGILHESPHGDMIDREFPITSLLAYRSSSIIETGIGNQLKDDSSPHLFPSNLRNDLLDSNTTESENVTPTRTIAISAYAAPLARIDDISNISPQENGSTKYFQGVTHSPNMGEKVAQIYRTTSVVPAMEKNASGRMSVTPYNIVKKGKNVLIHSNILLIFICDNFHI